MSQIFSQLIRGSRRINRDEFATTFGGISEDVIDMLTSEPAQRATREAREIMESASPLTSGLPRLRQMEYGLFSTAPELEQGLVAAVDGKPVLPLQKYTAGQAISVGVGSLSHRRAMSDSIHYWSSQALLAQSENTNDFIAIQEQGLFGISQTAYLRYYEVQHALEIDEPIVLLDGTLVYEWLVATREGVDLYVRLFESGKRCMGIIKSLRDNVVFSTFARALRQGEVYIIETLQDHLEQSNASNRNQGETASRYTLPEFHDNLAPRILRGIFRPKTKTFGFEVHENHLEDMLRIMCADCQMNNVGHEIPYLLNRVDEEVRSRFKPQILQDRIALQMAIESEEVFFTESDERSFR